MPKEEGWLSDFAFFTDLLGYINKLYLHLQGKNDFIDDLRRHMKPFKIKLSSFFNQLQKKLIFHIFENCSL